MACMALLCMHACMQGIHILVCMHEFRPTCAGWRCMHALRLWRLCAGHLRQAHNKRPIHACAILPCLCLPVLACMLHDKGACRQRRRAWLEVHVRRRPHACSSALVQPHHAARQFRTKPAPATPAAGYSLGGVVEGAAAGGAANMRLPLCCRCMPHPRLLNPACLVCPYKEQHL